MDARIGPSTGPSIDRFEGATSGGPTTVRAARRAGLSSREIEAEIVSRLARRGFDWTATLGRRRSEP